jgi:hypothetical protein
MSLMRVMRILRVMPILFVLLFSLSIASVYAAGYTVANPILGTTGAPALAPASAPGLSSNFAGVMTVRYADGMPVVLSTNHVTLKVCGASCETVSATLTQTDSGAYTYSFAPPSLSGTVTVIVQAGSLADDNGRIFPSVGTQIGTYASPTSPASGTPSTPASAPPAAPPPSSLSHEAVAETPSTPSKQAQASPVVGVAFLLTLLAVAGCFLLILPSRRH